VQAQAGWWRYLERQHTHEVLAEWRAREGVLHVRETMPGAPDARLDETLPIHAPWEARVALWQLAARLHALGAYWEQRSTDGAWRALAKPAGAPTPDMRANTVIDARLAPLLHHFHDERGGGDTLVAAIKAARAERFVVVRAQLDVPSLDVGDIDVLHPMLPHAMSRSLVLKEQMHLAAAGLGKLTTHSDYARAFGDGGETRAQRLIDEVVTRVRDGRLERELRRFDESQEYADFLIAINDPRLRALHKRFLTASEENELLTQGPHAIAKAISAKRMQVDHTAQHLLTLLEASLLAREKMRSGKLEKGDAEVRALAHLTYYL
jgi:hypothetical protein